MTTDRLLATTLAELLRVHCPPEVVESAARSWNAELWAVLADAGMTSVGVPDGLGGSGGTADDAITVVSLAAAVAAPVPIAETLLIAGPLHAAAGLPWTGRPVTVAVDAGGVTIERRSGGWVIGGQALRVPWARVCERVLTVVPHGDGWLAVSVPATAFETRPGLNLAEEPRDDVHFLNTRLADEDVAPLIGLTGSDMLLAGALARAVATAGALTAVLELTRTYVREREQFGRPIASFQAVKQLFAQLACEVGAAAAAAGGAAAARGPNREFAIAAAKVRSARAATRASEIAHQLHGALGFTREHRLQHLTRRVWSWRDEFGTEGEWERRIGRMALAAGPEALWPTIVGD